jgi:tRNA(His) guanylyltransferase
LTEAIIFIGIQGAGKSTFFQLTREVHQFKAKFDERFRDMMVSTTEHLMKGSIWRVYLAFDRGVV